MDAWRRVCRVVRCVANVVALLAAAVERLLVVLDDR